MHCWGEVSVCFFLHSRTRVSNGGSLHAAKRSCKPIPLGWTPAGLVAVWGFRVSLGIQEDQLASRKISQIRRAYSEAEGNGPLLSFRSRVQGLAPLGGPDVTCRS